MPLPEPPIINKTLQELEDNPRLLKKYSKQSFSQYLRDLIKEGDIQKIDSFLGLPFPKNKEVGVHIWNQKSNCWSYCEDYLIDALKNRHTHVFEYFYSQHEFSTKTIIDRVCSDNNIEMINYILNHFPPENIKTRFNLLNSAMNDNFLDQFKLLLTHPKNPVCEIDFSVLLNLSLEFVNVFSSSLIL